MKKYFLGILAVLVSLPVCAQPQQDPEAFVQSRAQALLSRLNGQREAIRENAEIANQIVREELLPSIDVEYISKLVLGPHWRNASEAQRQKFMQAFTDFLIRSYASGLAEFTEDRMKVLPLRGEADPRRTIVQTEVYRDTGQPVPVAYTLRWTDNGGWKLYDVIIEGISYVRNYRTDFNTHVQQKGLDSLIERLEKSEAEQTSTAEAA